MRLGAQLFGDISTPEKWIKLLKTKGYSAAYCPVDENAPDDLIEEYRLAAKENNIIISEVGAWMNNTIHPDPVVRKQHIKNVIVKLRLAEKIGANCCVNILGTMADGWDEYHSQDMSERSFELAAESVGKILREVDPLRTFYSLEMMQYMIPTCADDYFRLIEMIDHPRFGVHLDVTNIINGVDKYMNTGKVIDDCFNKLGPFIRSLHAKDMKLTGKCDVHIFEVPVGQGNMDYDKMLRRVEDTNPDLPVMLEHLETEELYDGADAHIRMVAKRQNIKII